MNNFNRSFSPLTQSDIIGRFPGNYGRRVLENTCSTYDNRFVSSIFVWKEPIGCETQDFSGTNKMRRKKYGRSSALCTKSHGWLSNLSHLENAIMLAYWPDRTQFFNVHLPSEYFKLPISFHNSYYLDSSAEMIHRALKMTYESFIVLDPP